jgi:hypothetical protein
MQYLNDEEHTFTRYLVTLRPMLFFGETVLFSGEWVELERIANLSFSSGHRRVLKRLYEAIDHVTTLYPTPSR